MKFYSLVTLLSLTCANVMGQSRVTGTVIDKHSNTPISQVSVQVLPSDKGTFTSEQGIFNFNEPLTGCKLYFTAIGYKDTLVDVSYFKNNPLLYLSPQTYSLPEFCIYPSKMQRARMGISWYSTINGAFHSKIGSHYSTYFPNNKGLKGYIESFSLKISSKSRWNCPFKLRIMKVDTTFQTIGVPMLLKDIDIRASHSGWCTVDLSSYKLPIPKEGFIVSVIVIDAGPEYSYIVKNGRDLNYGIAIELSSHPHEGLPWGYIWSEKRFGMRYPIKKFYYAVKTTLKVL